MQEMPGDTCICSQQHGEDQSHEHEDWVDDPDRCTDCGAELEWRLDVDGVQHHECPKCRTDTENSDSSSDFIETA